MIAEPGWLENIIVDAMSSLWLMVYGGDHFMLSTNAFIMDSLFGTMHTIPIAMPPIYYFYMSKKNPKILMLQILLSFFLFNSQ